MNKGKVVRLAGFVGALGLSTVLVTTAIQGTGAYFSDATNSSITANSGHLQLQTKPEGALNYVARDSFDALDYKDLMPGTPTTYTGHTIEFKPAVSSGNVDVWLVFDPSTAGYQNFTGGKDSPQSADTDNDGKLDGGLGRYGYFSVKDTNDNVIFRSGNLSFPDYVKGSSENNTWPQSNFCSVDEWGHGGSDWTATKSDYTPTGYCGVPASIRLAAGLTSGQYGKVTITFGLNGFMQYDQDQTEFSGSVPFSLVATQAGVRPELGNTYKH